MLRNQSKGFTEQHSMRNLIAIQQNISAYFEQSMNENISATILHSTTPWLLKEYKVNTILSLALKSQLILIIV